MGAAVTRVPPDAVRNRDGGGFAFCARPGGTFGRAAAGDSGRRLRVWKQQQLGRTSVASLLMETLCASGLSA